MIRSFIRFELLVTCVPLMWAACAGSQANREGSTVADREKGSPTTTALEGGGFALDVPIWQPEEHDKPKRLVASYRWGDEGVRTKEAERQNDRWRLVFADRPKPNEIAELTFRYEFALSTSDRERLSKASREVVDGVLDTAATKGGSGGPEFAKALADSLDSEAASTLQRYSTATGRDGLAVVTDALGLRSVPDKGWEIDATRANELVAIAAARLEDGAAARSVEEIAKLRAQLAKQEPGDHEGSCIPPGETAAEQEKSLRECMKTLAALAAQQPNAPPEVAAKSERLRTLAGADATPSWLDDVGNASNILLLQVQLGDTYSARTLRYARELLQKPVLQAAWAKRELEMLAEIDTALESTTRQEIGSTLLEGAAQPRRYDIATGVIYVAGLHDAVVPMLITICGWEGCLAPDDVFWDAAHGFGRAWSLDAGIRAKTLDTQDPRQGDTISFALGLSFNPVTVLRFSMGLYAFENAANHEHHWNMQPYIGVTFNVLNAASLLGGLGLGEDLAPTATPVE